jgi:peptidoglycan/LPS O-acetylase OafA/YrhL
MAVEQVEKQVRPSGSHDLAGYRPDVDGLRAVAVLSVLLFHVGLPFLPGGYIGVDIFFVISGFVIIRRMKIDLIENNFSIAEFYARRIRRILPALTFMLAFSFLIFAMILPRDEMTDFSWSTVAAALSVSNIYFWKTSGYFDPSSAIRPLLHTWSLGVEEQFYLFIPILMALTYRRSMTGTKLVLIAIAVVSFALSVFLMFKAPSANFYSLPTRAWELMIGALVALYAFPALTPHAIRESLSLLGAIMIAIGLFAYDSTTPFPGLTAALPTGGAALLIMTGAHSSTFASRLLSAGPMVAIGLISYSLYLAHWPVIVLTRYLLLREPSYAEMAGIIVASFALAIFSWRYIERPFRKHAPNLRARTLIAGAATLLGISAIASAGAMVAGGAAKPTVGTTVASAAGKDLSWRIGTCFLLANTPLSKWNLEACRRTSGANETAILWGDSFAAHYIPGLVSSAPLGRDIVQYTAAGCPPILSYQSFALPNCTTFNAGIFDLIKRTNAKAVIMSARWDLVRGRGLDDVKATVEALTKAGVETYVIGPSPIFAFNPVYLASRKAGVEESGSARWYVNPEVEVARARLNGVQGLRAIDPLAILCEGHECDYMHGGSLMFGDYGHFSPFGSQLAVNRYFPGIGRSERAR